MSLRNRVSRLEMYMDHNTISVPIVNANGENVMTIDYPTGFKARARKNISITEAFRALEEMCGIEVVYQNKTGGVVIYEREDE